MKRTEQAVLYAESKLGGKYDQSKRWLNDPYTRDCSSYAWSAYDSAGYQMEDTTSTYEVYDKGFDQLWPAKGVKLGQQLGNIRTIMKNGYQPQAGDLVFYRTISSTRTNQITHVAIVENASKILHARGKAYGIRRDPITLYNNKIVAITRLKESLNIEINPPKTDYRQAICTGNGVNIRKQPTTQSVSLGKLYKGDTLQAKEAVNGWCEVYVKGNIAYIYSDYIQFK